MSLINTYQDYLKALKDSPTEMFWVVPDDLIVEPTFKFDIYFSHDNEYDRKINHVFLNGKYYDGIRLMSKHAPISEREFNTRFLIERKEWDMLVSNPKPFDKFYIDSYQDYLNALANSNTELFWVIPSDVEILESFNFDFYFPYYDRANRQMNHMFLNGKYYDGVMLLSKHYPISEREFNTRFLIERKEWDIVISKPKPFNKFYIDSYQDYLDAVSNASTELFWAIPKEVEVLNQFNFDFYFPYYDRPNRQMHHAFKNLLENDSNYNGIQLISKNNLITEKEIVYRSIIEKQNHNIDASKPRPYDIIFISYNEPNADENFNNLKIRFPQAKRIHGVKGIHRAHVQAAELANTKMFWVVDGDAHILDEFDFSYIVPVWNFDTVHVWRSQNPINNLEYGYGGVKLLPRTLTLNMDMTSTDMTTSISDSFKIMDSASNITAFNTDPFSTWKSAFRECAKLASSSIRGQIDAETIDRLNVWCTQGSDRLFGEFAIAGAIAGKQFAEMHPDDVHKINDFDYLNSLFNRST